MRIFILDDVDDDGDDDDDNDDPTSTFHPTYLINYS